VNKRPLAPKTFEQVRPGDVLKFGESQRIYLLAGPEYQRPPELESETLAKVRQALKEKEARRDARKKALELRGSGDAAAVAAAIAARVSAGCSYMYIYPSNLHCVHAFPPPPNSVRARTFAQLH